MKLQSEADPYINYEKSQASLNRDMKTAKKLSSVLGRHNLSNLKLMSKFIADTRMKGNSYFDMQADRRRIDTTDSDLKILLKVWHREETNASRNVNQMYTSQRANTVNDSLK